LPPVALVERLPPEEAPPPVEEPFEPPPFVALVLVDSREVVVFAASPLCRGCGCWVRWVGLPRTAASPAYASTDDSVAWAGAHAISHTAPAAAKVALDAMNMGSR
jgi:hypothetical protein